MGGLGRGGCSCDVYNPLRRIVYTARLAHPACSAQLVPRRSPGIFELVLIVLYAAKQPAEESSHEDRKSCDEHDETRHCRIWSRKTKDTANGHHDETDGQHQDECNHFSQLTSTQVCSWYAPELFNYIIFTIKCNTIHHLLREERRRNLSGQSRALSVLRDNQ